MRPSALNNNSFLEQHAAASRTPPTALATFFLTAEALPRLLEPQSTGITTLGLEGYEEARTASGIVFYRQGWWCTVR